MRGIRFRKQGFVSAVGVELPDERGRLGECLGGGERGCFVLPPPTAGTAEGLQRQRGRGIWCGGRTPRPEAAERPAPQRATTLFAFANVSRKDCICSGVMMA
jgi:hypothetical protein